MKKTIEKMNKRVRKEGERKQHDACLINHEHTREGKAV